MVLPPTALWPALGFDRDRSKRASFLAANEGGKEWWLLESRALFQKPRFTSSSAVRRQDADLALGGLICRDKSG